MLTASDLAFMKATQNKALPNTCTIQRRTLTSDGMGGYIESWSDLATGVPCRIASIVYYRPNEWVIAEQQVGTTFWQLTMPAGQEIAAKDRVLVAGGDTVSAGETLVNGGFEAGDLTGWTVGSGTPTVQSVSVHSGQYGLEAQGDGLADLVVVTQTQPVHAGGNYYAGVWCRNASGAGAAGCYVSWLDDVGVTIETVDAFGYIDQTFTRQATYVKAPAAAASATFGLTIRADNISVVYFDDAELRWLEAPATPVQVGYEVVGLQSGGAWETAKRALLVRLA